MKHRAEKLSSLIREEAALFLEMHADIPPGVLCTVTQVALSADGRYADVFISIFPKLSLKCLMTSKVVSV